MRQSSKNRTEGGGVRSVERALRLLEEISALGGANLTRLARETGFSLSTCHRLLTTLQGRGFVQWNRASGYWLMGARTLAVGASFANARNLVALARHIMLRTARETGATVNLGAAAGQDVLFIQRVDSTNAGSTRPWDRSIPLHCSSIGKALLAGLPEREVVDLIGTRTLAACTENSITQPKRLLAQLRQCGRRGFAVDDQENTIGLRCVAAPIFDEFRRPVAALSIAAPANRLDGEQIARFAGIITAAAREITLAYGGEQPITH
jgi:IclR family transcriptional regulator, acetate operon repressor